MTDDTSDPTEKARKIESDVPLGLPQKTPGECLREFKQALKELPEANYLRPTLEVEFESSLIGHYDPKTEKFNPVEIACNLIGTFRILTDKTIGTIYLYYQPNGLYRRDGEAILRYLIQRHLGDESRTHRRNEIIDRIKDMTGSEIIFSQKLAVDNGLLDPSTGTDGTPKPFTPKEFVVHKLNATLKKDAKCPKYEQFIEQVCPADKLALQEWSGYLLLPNYPIHKIAWLLGTGRNGKGAWTRTMQAILGQENCSALSLEQFDGAHRFALTRLKSSLFNVASEPKTKKNLDTELLKFVTGKDRIDGEIKGKQDTIQFTNYAKMTVMGNEFPPVKDTTDAFWDRVLLINFPNRFIEGKNQILDIENIWLNDPEERSGILNWMLTGLKRLLTSGKFTISKTQEQMIVEFKRASDSVGAFLHEVAIIGGQEITTRKQAYETYKDYCEIIGVSPVDEKFFTPRLKSTPRIRDTTKRIEGVKSRVWQGLKLGELPKEPEEEDFQLKLDISGTDGTVGTPFSLPQNSEVKNKREYTCVPIVPGVPGTILKDESDLTGYHQLTCYFCQKPITDADWTSDDFTESKPAHLKCYDQKKSGLKEAEDQKEFSDDPPREGEQE